MVRAVSFTLNGTAKQITVDDDRSLLWVLRGDLGVTSVKYGCGDDRCGACAVIVDQQAVRACRVPMREVAGKQVLTVEGLSPNGKLHPIQNAFLGHVAFQCGFCTPGMILSAYALLLKNPKPTRENIIEAMDGHLCRCGSYTRIIDAIQEVAGTLPAAARKGGAA
jgi:aerobic-type carbon monoxide dehydrogenase small subunit (CoxS/CutS family)